MNKTTTKKELFQSIKDLIQQAQQHIIRNVNTTMLITYFEIGKMIVEDELQGKHRANYSGQVVRQLSIYLTKEFGKGYSKSNLEYMRQFYRMYQNRIVQSPIGQSSKGAVINQKSASVVRKSEITQTLIGQSQIPFSLSWTHYVQLLKSIAQMNVIFMK